MAEVEKDFNAFVCSQNGIFKGLSVKKTGQIIKNFDNVSTLSKSNGYTHMVLGENPNEILVANRVPEIKIFNIQDKCFSKVLKVGDGDETGKREIIVGITSFDGKVVTVAQHGPVKIWKDGEVISSVNALENHVNSMNSMNSMKKGKFATEEEREKKLESLKIGRKITKMRRCPSSFNPTEPLIAIAGQEVELQVWNLNNLKEPVFRARNVPLDFLDLRVPVWISDLVFLSANAIAVCTRHGFIRKYDITPRHLYKRKKVDVEKEDDLEKDEGIGKEVENEDDIEKVEEKKEMTDYERRHDEIKRKEIRKIEAMKRLESRGKARPGQRRPVGIIEWLEKDEEATCTAICAVNEHQVLCGGATGQLALWDFRMVYGKKVKVYKKGPAVRGMVKKFKGCVGAIKEVCYSNGYIGAVGLDRFFRIFDINGKYKLNTLKPLYNIYLKSKLTGLILMPHFDPTLVSPEDEADATAGAITDASAADATAIAFAKFRQEKNDAAIARTRLDELLELPPNKQKDKKHLFAKFFKDTIAERKALKSTASTTQKDNAMSAIQKKFTQFKNAHAIRSLCGDDADSDLDEAPQKRRKMK